MGVTPIELNKELESDKFRPVYYFFGEADFRIKEAEKAVIRRFLPKSQISTNHFALSAQRMDLAEILTSLSVFPLMGERQAFTISDIQALSAQEIEKVVALLTPADPNRIVIFSSPSNKMPNKKTKIYGTLVAKTTSVEFKRVPEDQSERKIISVLKENNIQIEPEALRSLTELGGGDLGGLGEELNKVINYVGKGGTIKREDIAAICSDYQSFKIHELINMIIKGEISRAIEISETLLSQGESGSAILYQLGEHFVDLYLLKNGKSLPGRKKGTEWKYKGQTQVLSNSQLEKAIRLIAGADFDLRNNVKPEKMIIERLILNIGQSESPN